MDCLVMPVTILRRRSMRSRLGYRSLSEESPVTVVVGKEKREFLVDPLVLEESPFRVLLETMKRDDNGKMKNGKKKVVLVDVDAILFEHLLWLMHNDCSSLFQLNLQEIVDFYAQDC